jgi:hypothetical protein
VEIPAIPHFLSLLLQIKIPTISEIPIKTNTIIGIPLARKVFSGKNFR